MKKFRAEEVWEDFGQVVLRWRYMGHPGISWKCWEVRSYMKRVASCGKGRETVPGSEDA